MWSSLRSDLKEFVTSVADDSTQVLTTIDAKIQDLEEYDPNNPNSNNNGITKENSSLSLADDEQDKNDNGVSYNDDGEPMKEDTSTTEGETETATTSRGGEEGLVMMDGNLVDTGMTYEETGIISNANDEAKRRMGLEETYTKPLFQNEDSILKHLKEKRRLQAGVGEEGIKQEGEEEEEDKDVTVETIPLMAKEEEEENDDGITSANENTATPIEPESDQTEGETGELEENEDEVMDEDDPEETHHKIQFIKSFDLDSKTEDISILLQSTTTPSPTPLQEHYTNLVPTQVTYEQFWVRYYYRCSTEHIEDEWERTKERKRVERQELIDASVNSVKNMFGGAVKALQGVAAKSNSADTTAKAPTSIYEKYQAELKEQQEAMRMDSNPNNTTTVEEQPRGGKVGSGLGSFFGAGRPPFALNTADSGDDDEEYVVDNNVEEEEEYEDDSDEEEFGWGSDDDDDYEDEEDEEEEEDVEEEKSTTDRDVSEQEIVFSDEKKELNELIEQLRMTIFEKDAELGALKASLEDRENDVEGEKEERNNSIYKKELEDVKKNMESQENDITRLTKTLAQKEKEVEELHSEIETANATQDAAVVDTSKSLLNKELEDAQLTIQNLTRDIEQAEAKQMESDTLVTTLKSELEEQNQSLEQQKVEYEDMLATKGNDSDTLVLGLKSELEESRRLLEQHKKESEDGLMTKQQKSDDLILSLKSELEESKQLLEQQKMQYEQQMVTKEKDSESLVSSLKSKLEESKQLLEQQKVEYEQKLANAMEEQAQKAKQCEEQEKNLAASTASSVSMLSASAVEEESSSTSSGVKVPLASSLEKLDALGDDNEEEEDDDDEEGWGDSWSDDDE